MRVLAMVHAYPPAYNAGAEMTMHAMLRRLVQDGHDVDVVVSEPIAGMNPSVHDYEGVTVHPHVNASDPMPFFTDKPKRADVVISHLHNTLRAAALCDIHQIPMVHLVHNTHEFTRGAIRRGPCQLAVFNSHWMHEDFKGFWGRVSSAPMPSSIVVHPPVDPQDYAAPKHGSRVTLINLTQAKGGELLWRLAEALPAVKFLGVRGAYGEQVIRSEARWPPNVEVLDHVTPTEMASKVYGQTKLLLMPSVYESYGRTAIEAAHNGIPTIAHPTPGLREALGNTGTFVDRDDLAGWVAAIRYLSSPRGFSAASKRVKTYASSLDFEGDLTRFVDAMEGVVRRGFAAIAG